MRSVHSGWYRPFSATRSKVSASAMGTRTHASRTAVYRGISGGVLPAGGVPAGGLQGSGVVLGGAAVDACLAGVLGHPVQGLAPILALAFGVGEQVGEQDPAVPYWLVVGDLAVFQEL